jgi:hypothetical protein
VSIPGCVVEFYDTTLLPGRFQIRIGDVLFDVMERGIEVGGKEVDWKPAESDPAQPRTRPDLATSP